MTLPRQEDQRQPARPVHDIRPAATGQTPPTMPIAGQAEFMRGDQPVPAPHFQAFAGTSQRVPMPMAILPAQAAPFSERALQRAPKIRHPNRPPCTKPSKTLYIRNLNEKIKPPVLKSALEALFETYGEVLEVRVRTSVRMRGQAFIAFKQEGDAARAHSEVQGFALFEKPMFIEFARVPSDATVANEGGDVEEHKRRRIDEREKREEELEQQRRQPRADASQLSTAELPNKILFLQGLPADIGAPEIEGAFKMFPGFVEVRWVSVKPDVAFVEFEADFQSGAAKASLGSQWSPRPDQPPVSVSFAKH